MTIRRLRWLGTGPLVAVVGTPGKDGTNGTAGASGASAAKQAFDAGLISAPTAQALTDYLAGQAIAVVSVSPLNTYPINKILKGR